MQLHKIQSTILYHLRNKGWVLILKDSDYQWSAGSGRLHQLLGRRHQMGQGGSITGRGRPRGALLAFPEIAHRRHHRVSLFGRDTAFGFFGKNDANQIDSGLTGDQGVFWIRNAAHFDELASLCVRSSNSLYIVALTILVVILIQAQSLNGL